MIYLVLLLSAIVIFFTINPIKIKKLIVGMTFASVISIFLLYIFGFIDSETIYRALINNGNIQPWKVLVIFFSVAYISISTDITGLFDYLSYKIIFYSKGDGIKLFFFFYLFSGILSIFTSNDIVILTLTPIIFYLKKHAKINILPLLFAQFFAANTFSMLLYIDNPTNIMVVNAMNIGFLEYFKIMLFPTIVAGLLTGFLLFTLFKKVITKRFVLKDYAEFHVRNWIDAFISLGLLIMMFLYLILSEYINLPIWAITLSFLVLFVIEDLIFSVYYYVSSKELSNSQKGKNADVFNILSYKNEFILAIRRIPWSILPFIIFFFIVVELLNEVFIIDKIASLISMYSSSVLSSAFITGTISFVTANLINNQPMTILFSSIVSSGSFYANILETKVATYALIISSNLGANLTIIGALAGIMWKNILKTKGVKISYLDFIKIGVVITPIVFIVTLLTLVLVVRIYN